MDNLEMGFQIKIIKIIILILLLDLHYSISLSSSPISSNEIPDGEVTIYKQTLGEMTFWHKDQNKSELSNAYLPPIEIIRNEIKYIEQSGKQYYQFHSIVDDEKGDYHELRSLWERSGVPKLNYFYEKLVRFGNLIFEKEGFFDTKLFNPPSNTLPGKHFAFALRMIPFEKSKIKSFHLWDSDVINNMYFKVEKEEKVKVKAGSFLCYKIKLWPDLNDFVKIGNIIPSFIRPFIPDISYWYTVEPPHYLVKYNGPLGPPGTSDMNIELFNIESKGNSLENVENNDE